MEAIIVLEYSDEKTADGIAKAVSPDNYKTPPGLFIKTTKKDDNVLTVLRNKGKLSTLIATIDDFLFCVTTAEKTLRIAEGK